ncbi:ABC transporter ATP-binding protein [Thomasclavelia sp.]|uniref:ATP-binding cassette domain-containing protein n=1 Tax=Thomasclavelia sp. TaxID=3025757 RepID=UPI0025D53A74|nr:ABC transporter ATP-binding protein [Thomasclavelia sp.]
MITVTNINKSFKNNELFINTTFTINEGSKTLIKGINGSGKSVLLKLLVGYSKVDSGEIIIDDYILHKDKDFIQNAGISINAPEFLKNVSGLDNLLYLAKIRNIATTQDIIALAKKLDLENSLSKKYKTYSLGMKQKMRIIQALMDKPKYLILDEPFDALDHKSCNIVKELLNQHIQSGGTLIFTSHNAEFENFADDILELENKNIKILSNLKG